jgi:hypothetical protein
LDTRAAVRGVGSWHHKATLAPPQAERSRLSRDAGALHAGCDWHFAAFAATQQMRSLSEQQRTLVATGGENVGSD